MTSFSNFYCLDNNYYTERNGNGNTFLLRCSKSSQTSFLGATGIGDPEKKFNWFVLLDHRTCPKHGWKINTSLKKNLSSCSSDDSNGEEGDHWYSGTQGRGNPGCGVQTSQWLRWTSQQLKKKMNHVGNQEAEGPTDLVESEELKDYQNPERKSGQCQDHKVPGLPATRKLWVTRTF